MTNTCHVCEAQIEWLACDEGYLNSPDPDQEVTCKSCGTKYKTMHSCEYSEEQGSWCENWLEKL